MNRRISNPNTNFCLPDNIYQVESKEWRAGRKRQDLNAFGGLGRGAEGDARLREGDEADQESQDSRRGTHEQHQTQFTPQRFGEEAITARDRGHDAWGSASAL